MSIPFSIENRYECSKSIKHNYAMLSMMLDCDHSVMRDIEEMYSITQRPYVKPTKPGETLDRHEWSVFGNAQEVTVMAVLLRNHTLDETTAAFVRDAHLQVVEKLDLMDTEASFQVKTATMGETQLHVAEEDLEGSATFLVYPLPLIRKMVFIDRAPFIAYMKQIERRAADYVQGKSGWYITPTDAQYEDTVFEGSVPMGISMVYYDKWSQCVTTSTDI